MFNNLSQVLPRSYGLGETKSFLQAMFEVFQATVSDITLKELFQPNGVEFQETERGFYSSHP